MTTHYLQGSETVDAAARRMAYAAEQMQQAANSISESVSRLEQLLLMAQVAVDEAEKSASAMLVDRISDLGVALGR